MINVLEYLEATSRRCPLRSAVIDRDGSLSFSELAAASRILAGRISATTNTCNQPIAVYLPKSRQCLIAFAAALYSGNCYAPLDIKSPASRLEKLLLKLDPALVITDRAHSGDLLAAGVDEKRILCIGGDPQHWEPVSGLPRATIDSDPVYIIHTSGSSGVPKGVVISHRGVIDYIEWAMECYAVTQEDTIGNQAPFHFDNSTLDIYLSFATGATLVLIPEECFFFPIRLIEYVREQSIRLIFWVPSVLASVANTDALAANDLPALRKVLFAGEVMHNRHLNYWRKKLPHALFSNLYGPTEITVDCTYYLVDRDFGDDEPLPIGFPCRNSDVLILNADNKRAAIGERGELCVRGSSLALGYWNDPERTAAVFVENPLNPHFPELIYRTGDIVYINGRGEIYFVGRNDSQIKHQGYRIELGEIDAAAMSVAEIRNVCALYDTVRGRIVLYYEADSDLEPVYLRKALLERLPKYMVPTAFLRTAALPMKSNGKIDRGALSIDSEAA